MRHSHHKKWKKENISSHIHLFHLMRIQWFKTQGMAIRYNWPNHNDRGLQGTEIFWRNITVAQYKLAYFLTSSPPESVMDRAALKCFRRHLKSLMLIFRKKLCLPFPHSWPVVKKKKPKVCVQILYMPFVGIAQQALKQSLLLLLPSDR